MNTVKISLKATTLFTIIMLTVAANANTQGKHSFTVGSSPTGVLDQGLSLNWEDLGIPLKPTKYKNIGGLPPVYFAYRYNLSQKWNIGLSAQFRSYGQRIIENVVSNDGKVISENIGERVVNSTNVSIESQYFYFRKPALAMYSGVGLGFDFKNRQLTYNEQAADPNPDYYDISNSPNFHITAIGIQAGKRIGGFAEVGFGYKGIVQLGIYANL